MFVQNLVRNNYVSLSSLHHEGDTHRNIRMQSWPIIAIAIRNSDVQFQRTRHVVMWVFFSFFSARSYVLPCSCILPSFNEFQRSEERHSLSVVPQSIVSSCWWRTQSTRNRSMKESMASTSNPNNWCADAPKVLGVL